MTDRRTPTSDQFLVTWFEDGPTTMPDRMIDVVADRIGHQRQRPSWHLSWRLSMNSPFKIVAGLAAIVLVAVVGYSILPRTGPGPVGPSPTPTVAPTVEPVPTVARVVCDEGTAGCLGRLDGGTYSSANFKPKLTYTVPAGPNGGAPVAFWNNSVDLTRSYTLVPPGGGPYSFSIQSEVAIPEQTADCSTAQKAGVGNAVADWVTFITEHPGLDAKAPVAVTIGGFSGFRVDFARAASWTAACSGPVGPVVMMFMHPGHDGVRWTDDQQESFWFIDVAGETVIIALDSSPDPAQHTADVANAQPVIDSFVFKP